MAQVDLSQCQGSSFTVFAVTGSPEHVWRQYMEREGAATAYEASVDGRRLRQIRGGEFGYSEIVTLIEGRDLSRPVLAVDVCAD